MKTLKILYFPTVEAGRKALAAIAEFLLENEVSQDGPFMNPAMMPLEHDEPVQDQRKAIFDDEFDQWEAEIPGGFRVGHPIDLDELKESLPDDVIIFRNRAELAVDHNPFYHMQRHYMGDKPNAGDMDRVPMTTPWLFIQGMESIHVQPQYKGVPGYWVIINCKGTTAGVELLEALNEMFRQNDQEQPSLQDPHSPLPTEQLNTVEGIAQVMATKVYAPYAETLFQILKILAVIRPREFYGDLIYVWEELMRHYTTLDALDKAVGCLEIMAELNPDLSDPWLNLGFTYNLFGHSGKALETYLEGVNRFPTDEYLHHNLASLLMDLGHHTKALHFLNEAILANPDRAVNYKLKGDIHAQRQELCPAMFAYQQAVQLLDDDDPHWLWQDCIKNLAVCFDEEGTTDHGRKLRQLYAVDGDVRGFVRRTQNWLQTESDGRTVTDGETTNDEST